MGKKAESSSRASRPAASQALANILPKSKPNGTIGDEKADSDSTSTLSTGPKRQQGANWRTASWRGKASAVAGLTQSISAAASTAADAVQTQIPAARSAAPQLRSLRTNSKSAASVAAPTCLIITANGQDEHIDSIVGQESEDGKETASESREAQRESLGTKRIESLQEGEAKEIKADTAERPLPQEGWGGWWARSSNPSADDGKEQSSAGKEDEDRTPPPKDNRMDRQPSVQQASRKALDPVKSKSPAQVPLPPPSQQERDELKSAAPVTAKAEHIVNNENRSSWFGLWNNSTGSKQIEESQSTKEELAPLSAVQSDDQTQAKASKQASTMRRPRPSDTDSLPPGGSGSWAFWSRDQPRPVSSTSATSKSQAETGELAVAKPETSTHAKADKGVDSAAVVNSAKGKSKNKGKKQAIIVADTSSLASRNNTKQDESLGIKIKIASKVTEPSPIQGKDKLTPGNTIPAPDSSSIPSDGQAILQESDKPSAAEPLVAIIDNSSPKSTEKTSAKQARLHADVVLPSVRETYQVAETTTYWQQFMHVLGRGAEPEQRHIAISSSPPRIKHALAIGVHGLFPSPLMQKVLGTPTGTSINFANGAAMAIQKWTAKQGYGCEIEKAALEGEGLIVDRVDTLWKLLLNWLENIRKADFIIMACHSQGVPVATILMAKLINLGCLNPSVRLGICAMAGVSLGPFPSYIGKLFGPAATELFSFSIPSSPVSTVYLANLRTCLAHHVRITYIGSFDDQLVSLESAVFANISHPYIYRTIFIDGRIHAPDFLIKLLGFAMKLRNLGISDHGLIRELSPAVAGSLYSGGGHSQVYKHHEVYDCAVEFAMETTTLGTGRVGHLLEVKQGYEVPGTNGNANPYILPFAMRGVLEEREVREGELRAEMQELLKLFDQWKPTTKGLKDVKFRLEAVKSQL